MESGAGAGAGPLADNPHGGDLNALKMTFISATQKTREAVAQYRA